MRHVWTFHTAGSFLFGRGAADQLGDIAGRLRAQRVLVVTDPVLLKEEYPTLYGQLVQFYRQDPAARVRRKLER